MAGYPNIQGDASCPRTRRLVQVTGSSSVSAPTSSLTVVTDPSPQSSPEWRHMGKTERPPPPHRNSQITVRRSTVRPKQACRPCGSNGLASTGHHHHVSLLQPSPSGKRQQENALSLNSQACKQLSPREAVPLSQHPTHRVRVNSSSARSLPRAPQPRAPGEGGLEPISNAKAASLVNFTELPLVLKLCSWQKYGMSRMAHDMLF